MIAHVYIYMYIYIYTHICMYAQHKQVQHIPIHIIYILSVWSFCESYACPDPDWKPVKVSLRSARTPQQQYVRISFKSGTPFVGVALFIPSGMESYV